MLQQGSENCRFGLVRDRIELTWDYTPLSRFSTSRRRSPRNAATTTFADSTGDKSFKNMSDEDFDLVTLVHLKGAYSCTKAVWPLFRQQKVTWTSLDRDYADSSSDESSTPHPLLDCTETWAKPITPPLRVRQTQILGNASDFQWASSLSQGHSLAREPSTTSSRTSSSR